MTLGSSDLYTSQSSFDLKRSMIIQPFCNKILKMMIVIHISIRKSKCLNNFTFRGGIRYMRLIAFNRISLLFKRTHNNPNIVTPRKQETIERLGLKQVGTKPNFFVRLYVTDTYSFLTIQANLSLLECHTIKFTLQPHCFAPKDPKYY